MYIDSVIEIIKKRPGMYLGGESITALRYFILGYNLAFVDRF